MFSPSSHTRVSSSSTTTAATNASTASTSAGAYNPRGAPQYATTNGNGASHARPLTAGIYAPIPTFFLPDSEDLGQSMSAETNYPASR